MPKTHTELPHYFENGLSAIYLNKLFAFYFPENATFSNGNLSTNRSRIYPRNFFVHYNKGGLVSKFDPQKVSNSTHILKIKT